MTKLHLPQEEVDNAQWNVGRIPPEGAAIPFEITTTKDNESEVGKIGEAVYGPGKDREGESYEYLVIDFLYYEEGNDEPYRHGEFFDLDADWGKGKLKALIEGLGYRYEEGMDLNTLNGLRFTCDVGHRDSAKGPQANLQYSTIVVEADESAEAQAPQAPPRKPPRRSAR